MMHVFHALCKSVDTPVSLGLWLRYKHGEHKQLAEFEVNPKDYTEKDYVKFVSDYGCASFLSKWKGLTTGIDTADQALKKFITSESACRETNERLIKGREKGVSPFIDSVLFAAQRKISSLLGPFSLHKISPFFGWGPGATYDISRRRAHVDVKISALPITVSARNSGLFRSVIVDDRHWSEAIVGTRIEGPFCFTQDVFRLEEHCRVETVPKNAKTDRVIAIEPTGNLFIQKGYGGFLRRRLKAVGIDLDDQKINQVLASKALTDDLATLDLRAASDTVSKELVFELLPFDWASALDDARSHFAKLPSGESTKLEKFSSMGNGFTFELESLIFWALSSAVNDLLTPGALLSVYGDDIICHKMAYDGVVEVLAHCGFQVNETKSYSSGIFYESCGKHFFNGREATPLYQKETLANLDEVIHCHNRLYRWSARVGVSSETPRRALQRSCEREYRRYQISDDQASDDAFLVPVSDFVLNHRGDFSASRGWSARVRKVVSYPIPGIEIALLAHYFRLNSTSSSVMDVKPSYGDVEVIVLDENRKVATCDGRRWIIPTGVCPLPSMR